MTKKILSWAFFLPALSACTHLSNEKITLTNEQGFKVQSLFYKANSKEKANVHTTVLIFPPTGGVNYLDKSYARILQKKGANVYILLRWTGDTAESIDLSIHEKLHANAVKALGLILAKIPKTQKIAVLGTSLGALFTSISVNTYKQIDRAFIIAGGAPIPNIISESNNDGMLKLKSERFEFMDFKNEKDYATAIHKNFTLDPLDNHKDLKNTDLGMVTLTKDLSVPTKYQKKLQNYWAPQCHISLQAGHFWGIIRTWLFHSKPVTKFLLGQPCK